MNLKFLITLWLLIITSCQFKTTKDEKIEIKNTHNKSSPINQYKNAKKEGFWKTYYPNGQLKTEGTYESDLKEGLHKKWEENGTLALEGFYTRGKANGLMKWFHEKGHLAGEGNMKDNVRVGRWKICDVEDNGFCIDAFFKEGKRDGIWKINHENARDKLWKEQIWEADKIVSEKCWDEKGKEIECN